MPQSKTSEEYFVDLKEHLGFLLGDCARLLTTNIERQLRDTNIELSRAQWRVIAHLFRRDGVTQTQLADILQIERAPLGTLIDKLETRGLLERRPDKTDRRVNRLFITDAGRELVPSISQQVDQLLEEITADLSGDEVQHLKYCLNKVRNSLRSRRDSCAGSNAEPQATSNS